jgi:hypothetical protein
MSIFPRLMNYSTNPQRWALPNLKLSRLFRPSTDEETTREFFDFKAYTSRIDEKEQSIKQEINKDLTTEGEGVIMGKD